MRSLAALTLCALCAGCGGIRPPRGVEAQEREVVVTGYCDCGQCCGWERSWLRLGAPIYASGPLKGQRKAVGVTASGGRTRHGTAAVDRKRFAFGTIFEVPGYGYARAEDVGGAIQGDHIDLWFPSHQAAKNWGKRRLRIRFWPQAAR